MALDKLVDSSQLDADLASVAAAIRTKGGTSGQLAFPAGFISAVQAIPTGITPTGTKQISIAANGTTTEDVTNYANAEITVNVPSGPSPALVSKSITENGTYNAASDNADGYSSVTVNVEATGYDGGDWFDLTKPTGEITSTVVLTQNSPYIMQYHSGITKVNLPNATGLGESVLRSCKNLVAIYVPKVTYFSNNCLRQSTKLAYLVAPKFERIRQDACNGCTGLLAVDLGSNGAVGNGFQQGTVFSGCTQLATVVLRNTHGVVPLSNISVFTNTPFASGKAGGTLYVPQALIASYQAASNWSTILGYSTNSIQAIEGSIYETQYVDGTAIPTT